MVRECPVCGRSDFRTEEAMQLHLRKSHRTEWEDRFKDNRSMQKNIIDKWKNNL
jgi:hypothetical protein